MKNLKHTALTLIIAPLLIGTAFGQEKKKASKAHVKIQMVDDENGNVKSLDTSFILENKQQLKEILRKHGIDSETNESIEGAIRIELEKLEDGKQKFIIHEEEDENGELKKELRVIKMDLEDGEELDEEMRRKIEEAIKRSKEQMEIRRANGEDGENVFIIKSDGSKWESKDGSHDVKYEFKTDGEDGTEMIVKTVVLETDENGNVEKKVFETRSSHAMIFIRKSEDGEGAEAKMRMKEHLPNKIEEESLESINLKNLKLYPNPSNGEFTMSFKSKEAQDLNLSISNAKGEVLFNKDLKGFKGKFEENFDWTNQPKGVYFFNLKSGNENESRKIILQ